MRLLVAFALWLGLALPLSAEETLRVAVLRFGTVNWLMETIERRGLDTEAGFDLEVVALAGKPATTIALQSGDADMIVTDWVWAMRQHGEGTPYRFLPYSRSLGALLISKGSDITDLCDLRGREVGVVGGAIDKSWLVFQALARRDCEFDLAAETQSLFGAPPLMSRQLETGNVDAVSTYWHYAARLRAAGAQQLLSVEDALARLGIAPTPPLIGFVWNADSMDDRPGLIDKFATAVRRAGEILAGDDAAWEELRPMMKATSQAEFEALRDTYRAGIVSDWTAADTDAARALHEMLIGTGGQAYRKTSGPFVEQVFPSTGN